MHVPSFKKLYDEGLLPEESFQQIEKLESERLFSLYWELRTLLYLGIVLLAGGLGVLVYKHIDTIGHTAVLIFIGLVTGACFYYCGRNKLPFSWDKVAAPNPWFDYILLLGCLTLLIFLGYWQYVYSIFGTNYGMATFIPMLILFVSAYYFDHQGVLSMAITNLGAWAGITITPLTLLRDGNFDDDRLIKVGLLLGAFLLAIGWLSDRKKFKAHFQAVYTNFGLHTFFVAALSGLFSYSSIYLLWFLGMLGVAYLFYREAVSRRSFYFVLMTVLYSYIAFCYTIVRVIWMTLTDSRVVDPLFFIPLILIGSAVGLGFLLVRLNRQFKSTSHDRV